MMTGHYQVIDEVSYNVLGDFNSQDEALDFVSTLLSTNDASFLDELTIATDECMRLTGDILREALQRRAAHKRAVASRRGPASGGSTHGSNDSGHGALAAKGHE